MFKSIFNGLVLLLALNACSAQISEPNSSLTDTQWRLVSLFEQSVITLGGKKELFMVLNSKNDSVRGYLGCNNFFSSYYLQLASNHIDLLTFSKIGATRMYCRDKMQQEQNFIKALTQSDHFEILVNRLFLYDKTNQLIAEFESIVE